MCIVTSYSLICNDCRTSFHDAGEWQFETPEEAIERAVEAGWSIGEEVPNGSKWDFCPRCIAKRYTIDPNGTVCYTGDKLCARNLSWI